MANAEQIPVAKGPSMIIQAAMLLGMTVAALGIGWMSGSYLKGSEAPVKAPAAEGGEQAAAPSAAPGAALTVTELPSITTNLAAPVETWVRMDVSLLLDAALPNETIQAIHQDLLTFMRTVKMHQVEGASGFLHLKADLQERAAMRGDGHVKDVLIRTLLFE
ncbi:flagellar basal body-associated protein FliL [Mesorhizobium sp. Root157]|uniref:flagellar basal body-associated FliL family protein n=1 Tax=Mesorhizobium sp. Root157 TaxID=1736477 RepID=UPI0007023757|nr:flagellar basal body-associated FliL family protein [Mesorhizobium sp. Root157]KQZ87006.1 flagellar basal body-associated protein FliL [Mesorhizobium sp. Root157]